MRQQYHFLMALPRRVQYVVLLIPKEKNVD
jgi:hypothetical protein